MSYKKFFRTVAAIVGSFMLLVTIFLGVYIFTHRDKGIFNLATQLSDFFPISSKYKKRVNFLVLGLDKDKTRTDVDIFVSYQPDKKRADVIQMPRDTRLVFDENDRMAMKDNDYADPKNVPHHGIKLTEAHAYGGVGLTKFAVQKLLNNTPVDYYLKVDFTAFKGIVDAVGGIDINVPVDMYYSDPTQGLHIALSKGYKHLDGDKAEQFVRFRKYVNGDLDRIKAQREFLTVLGRKVISTDGIKNIIPIIENVNKYSKNDLSGSAVFAYARQALKMKESDVVFHSLPGEPKWINGVSYFLCDEDKTKLLVKQIMNGESIPSSTKNEEKSKVSNSDITVEVLNSTTINGLAKKVADRLRNEGYKISYVGNWSKGAYETSRIFKNSETVDGTKNVKSTLGLGKISKDYNASDDTHPEGKDSDVVLVIGKDMVDFK